MKKRLLVLSLLCLMGIIFLGAPTLAQNVDDRGTDEEVAPPAAGTNVPPVPPRRPPPGGLGRTVAVDLRAADPAGRVGAPVLGGIRAHAQ